MQRGGRPRRAPRGGALVEPPEQPREFLVVKRNNVGRRQRRILAVEGTRFCNLDRSRHRRNDFPLSSLVRLHKDPKDATQLTIFFADYNLRQNTALASPMESEAVKTIPVEVFVGTWNMEGRDLPPSLHLWVPLGDRRFDIYAIAAQESDRLDELWALNHFNGDLDVLAIHRVPGLGGMLMLAVIVRSNLRPAVSYLRKSLAYENEPSEAIGIVLQVYNTSMCFICARSPDGELSSSERTRHLAKIAASLRLGDAEVDLFARFDHLFWLGDSLFEPNLGEIEGKSIAPFFQSDRIPTRAAHGGHVLVRSLQSVIRRLDFSAAPALPGSDSRPVRALYAVLLRLPFTPVHSCPQCDIVITGLKARGLQCPAGLPDPYVRFHGPDFLLEVLQTKALTETDSPEWLDGQVPRLMPEPPHKVFVCRQRLVLMVLHDPAMQLPLGGCVLQLHGACGDRPVHLSAPIVHRGTRAGTLECLIHVVWRKATRFRGSTTS